jgi:very-short-patch-repair endonuclease
MGKQKSALELGFAQLWKQIGGPTPTTEFRFYPDRAWRFDFAWPAEKIAVELEGGIWSGGRHTRGKGFQEDCVKYYSAGMSGWTVFRLTGGMICAELLSPIRDLIAMKTAQRGTD